MQDRLKEIQDRVDKATDGPWIVSSEDICECPLCEGEGEVVSADIDGDGWTALAQTYGIGSMVFNNAQFIANAPSDIKFLLSALQEAQAEIKILKELNECFRCSVVSGGDRERVLREALERILNLHRTPIERPSKDGMNMRWDGKSYTYDNEGEIARESLGQEGK